VAAARLGQAEMAMRFFRHASATDVADTHAATDAACTSLPSGLWMMAVLGFAGLTIDASGLGFDPNLPAGWGTLAFSVQWRGRHVSIAIDTCRSTIQATLTAGEPMTISIGGEPHPVSKDAPLPVSMAGL
jgi:trehalose/maltose hydrolase-like predicted phosphorylase